jgi:hypothetical protein
VVGKAESDKPAHLAMSVRAALNLKTAKGEHISYSYDVTGVLVETALSENSLPFSTC